MVVKSEPVEFSYHKDDNTPETSKPLVEAHPLSVCDKSHSHSPISSGDEGDSELARLLTDIPYINKNPVFTNSRTFGRQSRFPSGLLFNHPNSMRNYEMTSAPLTVAPVCGSSLYPYCSNDSSCPSIACGNSHMTDCTNPMHQNAHACSSSASNVLPG